MFLEARVRTTTCKTYAWQCHAQLYDLLSSPVRINPHACVRHAPHYADTLFSGVWILIIELACTNEHFWGLSNLLNHKIACSAALLVYGRTNLVPHLYLMSLLDICNIIQKLGITIDLLFCSHLTHKKYILLIASNKAICL